MPPRIDALLCTHVSARGKVEALAAELREHAARARADVQCAVQQMVDALLERQRTLTCEVDVWEQRKATLLEEQLASIEAGTCRPVSRDGQVGALEAAAAGAPAADAAAAGADGSARFLLTTDSVINFRAHTEELGAQICTFGTIDVSSTYASKSFAQGPVIEGALKVNNQACLWVHACDLQGDLRQEGGEELLLSFSSPGSFEWSVEDAGDGRYRAAVVPKEEGCYALSVSIGLPGRGGGSVPEEIHGSPFALQVLPPKDHKKIGVVAPGVEEMWRPWINDAGLLRRPFGIAFDPTCRFVVVADQCNDRLQVFDVGSRAPVCAFGKKGCGNQDFNTPGSIVADREGRIVVSDVLNHRLQVLVFNPKAQSLWHVRTVGCQGRGECQFQFPRGLANTEDGHLLVADSGNQRVQVLNALDGFRFIRELGEQGGGPGSLNTPLDVAVNRKGEILVSDMNHRILVFDQAGAYLWAIGGKGAKAALFNHPSCIVVDDEDMLFVCDKGNRRVQVFNASEGSFVHKWGGRKRKPQGETDGGDNPEGEAAVAELGGQDSPVPVSEDDWLGLLAPAGITVSHHGMILVSDYERNLIYDF